MGGSAAEAPTIPDEPPVRGTRASDADRDEVVAKLTEEFAAGRLSHDTFLFRMHAVLEAKHLSDLPPLLADLPAAFGRPERPWRLVGPSQPAPPERPARPGLAARLRAALLSLPVSAAVSGGTPARRPGPGPGARRLTAGMPRAADGAWRPVPLQFPRGAGTLFSIGRDAGCDLTIADMTVSRVHARLERTPDGWLLTDLASTNGTRVNGWLVRGQVKVLAGDLVSFGKAAYLLRPAAEGI